MSKINAIRYFLCFILLSGIFIGLTVNHVAFAARENTVGPLLIPAGQEEPPVQETLGIEVKYPVLNAKSGETFDFDVDLQYLGNERRTLTLTLTAPAGWTAVAVAGYPEKQIPAITMGPSGAYPVTEKITVKLSSTKVLYPEPGEYIATLVASSSNLRESMELKAIVTARYEFQMFTATGRLDTEVTANQENHFSIELLNTGSAAIKNISLSSSKPEGWEVTFKPDKVDSLESLLTQEVDVMIKPPSRTVAGDYMLTIRAESEEVTPDPVDLRVTVLTPSIWGWVGVLIVLVVIGGVGVVFWRLGRR